MMLLNIKHLIFSVVLISVGFTDYLSAGSTVCNGSLPAGTYFNVEVRSGASCVMTGPGIVINGNFSAIGAADIDLENITIKGNVNVIGSKGNIFYLQDDIIGGNVSILDSVYKINLNINNSTISGNVSLNNNKVNLKNNPPVREQDNSIGIFAGSIGGNVSVVGNKSYNLISAGFFSDLKKNVTIKDNNSTGAMVILASSVGGNVSMTNNKGAGTSLEGSPFLIGIFLGFTEVVGNVTFTDNKALEGSIIDFEGLLVHRNLTCSHNKPTPTVTDYFGGGPVIVLGKQNCSIAP